MTNPVTFSPISTVAIGDDIGIVDCVVVNQKRESRPGTPRLGAKIDSDTGTSPSVIAGKTEEVGIPKSIKQTMRIVPKSPVEEDQHAKMDERPMSPLEISGELKEMKDMVCVSPSTKIGTTEEWKKGLVNEKSEGVHIPEDQNNVIIVSTIETATDSAKELPGAISTPALPIDSTESTSIKAMESLPSPSANSTSITTPAKESHHLAIPAVKEESPVSQDNESKTVAIVEESGPNLPVEILEGAKQDETISTDPTSISNATVLDEKKEDAISGESSTSSQLIQVERSEIDSNLDEKPDVVSTRDDIAGLAAPTLIDEKSTSSESPTDIHLNDQKDVPHQPDTSIKTSTENSQTPNQPKEASNEPANLNSLPAVISSPKDERSTEGKKSLHLFTKIKRRLSTMDMREFKKDAPPPTPTTAISFLPSPTTAVSSPSSSIETPKHIELVKTTSKVSTTASPKEGKKPDSFFKSFRAAMSFSSLRSPKSPRSPLSIKTSQTPVPSPTVTRARTWDKKSPLKPSSPTATKTPIRPSTAKAALKSSERVPTVAIPVPKSPLSPTSKRPQRLSLAAPQSSARRASQYSPLLKAPLRQTQTWSPPGIIPILASDPSAKLYTIWPRYPVVRAQMDEVQAVLAGFLPNDLEAIEKEYAPGRDANGEEVINFWKAPLTKEQAEDVKAIKFVSSIQLSKLDYDPSDYFC